MWIELDEDDLDDDEYRRWKDLAWTYGEEAAFMIVMSERRKR
jgi:hypothetical protein